MSQVRRHELIVDFVNRHGFANIEQLTSHFMVTPQTIRRDLNQLANSGHVRRHHGGASSSSSTKNSDYSDRLSFNMGSKTASPKASPAASLMALLYSLTLAPLPKLLLVLYFTTKTYKSLPIIYMWRLF